MAKSKADEEPDQVGLFWEGPPRTRSPEEAREELERRLAAAEATGDTVQIPALRAALDQLKRG